MHVSYVHIANKMATNYRIHNVFDNCDYFVRNKNLQQLRALFPRITFSLQIVSELTIYLRIGSENLKNMYSKFATHILF